MKLEEAYEKIDNLCCIAYNNDNSIVENEFKEPGICNGPEDMIDALETLKKAVDVLNIILKYPDIVNEIGIDSDATKVKWFFATHKDLNI